MLRMFQLNLLKLKVSALIMQWTVSALIMLTAIGTAKLLQKLSTPSHLTASPLKFSGSMTKTTGTAVTQALQSASLLLQPQRAAQSIPCGKVLQDPIRKPTTTTAQLLPQVFAPALKTAVVKISAIMLSIRLSQHPHSAHGLTLIQQAHTAHIM